MRFLLRATIEIANHGLYVCGTAKDGDDALAQWRAQRPEIVVLDNRMPGASGLEVAAQILTERPEQKIVLFSAHLDEPTRDAAERIGILACMSKRDIGSLPGALRGYAVDG